MGKQGLRELAERNVKKSHYTRDLLLQNSACRQHFSAPFFNEFVLLVPKARTVWNQLKEQGIIAGLPLEDWYPELKNCLLLCVTEMHTRSDIERFVREI